MNIKPEAVFLEQLVGWPWGVNFTCNDFYYIIVSGIPSGNKLIKTIRYTHMWRYRWFHWYQVCPLNCTYIRWFIIKTSSGLPQKSSAIFGDLRRFLENVWECLSGFWDSFVKSSEIFGKSSKTPSAVCVYNKKNITC